MTSYQNKHNDIMWCFLIIFFMLYAVYLQQPHVVKVSSVFSVQCWPWVRALAVWWLIPLRGPLSAACFWAPSSRSAFYCAWFTALYLWANSPGGGSPRCHTHTAQPLRGAHSPQTHTACTAHCYKWLPTLNMEMLWKVNLNIYIRWL